MNPLFTQYLAAQRGISVAVLGVGISNTPLIRLLAGAGAKITARDKKDRASLEPLASELEALGVRMVTGPGYLQGIGETYIYRTPGMRPDLPEIAAAVAAGSILTSEMEEFLRICPCPAIAVTGSDGKTTTTTLIAEMLRAEGKRVHLGGNIGMPLLSAAGDMDPGDIVVLELSSFQLMTMKMSPQTAAVLNLTPNHQDMHLSMEEYTAAKENIFLHQGKGDLVVLGADCGVTRAMAAKAPGRVRMFSHGAPVPHGVFLEGDTIICRDGAGDHALFPASDIRIPGAHNVDNYMAACAAVWPLVRPETMAQVARNFAGVPHRIQLVAERDGVRYYNDSIASTPARTLAGLRSFPQKVILIAGGYDKKVPFDTLGSACAQHVKALILIGVTAGAIRQAVEAADGAPPLYDAGDLETAVPLAERMAEPGDIVLLSPACASFDQYENFEERGMHFTRLARRP
ncbi:MAG: UDP-N-acetylmuramoyl-L-alanine--D-glutamate ligase [Oscillospiraceae bacterium]|nr:UDP-N-acetylmuramoyl-L-alanine--D-glutamate ligase [Oscillospiraceae bacterium]